MDSTMIWKKEITLERLNASSANTMAEAMGIVYTDFDDTSIRATMPITAAVRQPMGLLHGGASAALAETLGSVAGYFCCPEGFHIVGTEISANHLRSATQGEVEAIARPIHLGGKLQLWSIDIHHGTGDDAKLLCSARLTVMVKR
jgi:uncharacterized protein (TIGR00369 family)